jgi:methyl coenzyme M reductase subunit C
MSPGRRQFIRPAGEPPTSLRRANGFVSTVIGRSPGQFAISTGSSAAAKTWAVAPPKIIWRSRLCV